jgi:hypothetical protein
MIRVMRVPVVASIFAACMVASAAWGSSPARVAANSADYLLRGNVQVRLADYDWWCGLVPLISTTGARSTRPECGPWDSGAVGVWLDWSPDPTNLSFRLPLQVYAYRRPHYLGQTNRLRVYQFSFAVKDHPKRPTARLLTGKPSISFKGSAWHCRAVSASLVCDQTQRGVAQPPIVTVLPKRRMMQVQTSTAPVLLSGNGGVTAPFLYRIDG